MSHTALYYRKYEDTFYNVNHVCEQYISSDFSRQYTSLYSTLATVLSVPLIPTAVVCLRSQNSSTYWEGRSDMETLQRIYGISFPDSKMLKEWERFQEEARNRDHRKIGKVRRKEMKAARKCPDRMQNLLLAFVKSLHKCAVFLKELQTCQSV